MLLIILLIIIFVFIVYLIIDRMFISKNANAFFDKWTKKTLFLWLPFYALPRLIKEIFFDKR